MRVTWAHSHNESTRVRKIQRNPAFSGASGPGGSSAFGESLPPKRPLEARLHPPYSREFHPRDASTKTTCFCKWAFGGKTAQGGTRSAQC